MGDLSRVWFGLAAAAVAALQGFAIADTIQLDTQYADIQAQMRSLVALYPDRAAVVTIGESDSGSPIEALRVGTSGVANLVVATHHGNEYGSTEVAKAFMDSVAQAPLVGQTVYVVPVLNIPGYNSRSRREPARGTTWDPNRDYPGPCGTDGPHMLKSTTALARFVDSHQIVASATIHTFFPAVTYPWGVSASGDDLSTPYDTLFSNLAAAATVESRYQTGNSTDIVYAADGAFEDYAFWKHGIWSLLFEVSSTHTPNLTQVRRLVAENVPGLRRFLEQAPRERAELHEFTGTCDPSRSKDRQRE